MRRANRDFRTWGRNQRRRTDHANPKHLTDDRFVSIARRPLTGPCTHQQELVAKLEAAGYTQVSDIKSTPEGTTVKAIKNGKEVRLVVDSSGQIKEQK